MTITRVSFRDFLRGHIPSDILMLLDKKTKKEKGLFIAPKYAHDVLEFLNNKEKEEIERKKHALLDFVGEFGEDESITTESHQAIKAKKYE